MEVGELDCLLEATQASLILPNLFLGPLPSSYPESLRELNITHVIRLINWDEPALPDEVRMFCLRLSFCARQMILAQCIRTN